MQPTGAGQLRLPGDEVGAETASTQSGSKNSGRNSARISVSYDPSMRSGAQSDRISYKSSGRSSMVVTPSFEKRAFSRKSRTQEELRSQLSLMTGKEIDKVSSLDNIFDDPTPRILRVPSKDRMSFIVPQEKPNVFERKKKNFFWDMIKAQTKRTMMDKALLKMRRGTAVEQAFALTACSDRFLTIEERLAKMRVIFEAAKLDGQTGLNLDQFTRVARRQVETGLHQTDEEIRILFMKIDTNTDGIIQWEEFVTFNLLEYRERARMIEQARMRPFPHGMTEIKSSHYDQILRVLFIPRWTKGATTINEENGRYALLSVDGTLSLWTMEMKCLATHNMQDYAVRMVPSLYLDMTYIYITNMLCVSSTDRDISFFELHRNDIRRRYHLINLEAVVTALSSWSNLKTRAEVILVWGDLDGDIWSLVFNTRDYSEMFYRVSGAKSMSHEQMTVKFVDVQQKVYPAVKLHHLTPVHNSWVQRIVYVEELEGFLSCAHSERTSLYYGDLRGKWHRVYFEVTRGILCLEYSPKLNIFATGGIDHTLRLWNPYAHKKAVAMLEGFPNPVMQVGFHNRKNLVIGIDTSNLILVFDMYDYNCLQSIHGNTLKMGKFSISASYFNQVQEHLIICTSSVAILPTCDVETRKMEAPAHRKPVVAALYNKSFGLMVSGCRLSAINIWDTKTGEKLIDFQNAHSYFQDGKELPVQITCMAFDDQERRLLTGARDGSVKLWNLHVGLLLGELDVVDKQYVTCIVVMTAWIFVAGWGRRVIEYPDLHNERRRPRVWPKYHDEDILSLILIGKIYVVTASYDGDIIICSRETKTAVARMNAFQGIGVYNLFPHRKEPDMRPSSPNPPRTTSPSKKNVNQSADFEEDFDVDMTLLGLPADFKFSPSTYNPDFTTKLRKSITMPSFGVWSPEKRAKMVSRARNSLTDVFYPSDDWQPVVRDAGQEKVSVEQYDKLAQKYEAAVEQLLVLETRFHKMYDPYTAVLLAGGAEGWCRAWSLGGGLLGQFSVTAVSGESITRMALTENDEYLITADTLGYVKMWNIKNYCTPEKMDKDECDSKTAEEMYLFPYLHTTKSPRLKQVIKQTATSLRRPPPLRSRPSKTLFSPHMVNQYRAHAEPINWLEYVPGQRLIITAANCTIRVWTFSGRYVNSFGNQWEKLPDSPNPVEPSDIPRDIRRSGSPCTQRVVKGDVAEYWLHVASHFRSKIDVEECPYMPGNPYPEDPDLDENIRKYWVPELTARKHRLSAEARRELEETGLADQYTTELSDEQSEREAAMEKLEHAKQLLLNEQVQDARWRFRKKPFEQMKLEIAAFKEGSDILGKSYKRLRHYRPPPKLPPLNNADCKILVYHTLQTKEIEPTTKKPEPPPIVNEFTRINEILDSIKRSKKKVTRAELKRLRSIQAKRRSN